MSDIEESLLEQIGNNSVAPVGTSTEQELSDAATVDSNVEQTSSASYLSTNETTQVRAINDKFNSTYLPMIAESYSKIGKLSQADKYKALIALAPNMDFVKGESYKFVGWYLYLKSKFIEASEGDIKIEAEKLFKTFEDYDKGAMAEDQLSKDLLYVVSESIKSAKNKDVLVLTLGYPTNLSVFALLEAIREYHCGSRDIPVRFQTIFSKICYGAEGTGVTHDNIDGVKINLEYIKCLTWFHPLKYEMTETLQVNMFMNNMEPGYKSKFITYLTTKGDHKVLKELSDKLKCLDDVFNALVEFEQDASYDAKVNLLNSMVIPLSIRMNRKDGKSKAPSTTNKGAGNNKKDGKAGNKKAATKESAGTAAVKSSAVHIGAAHTGLVGTNPDDLNARHWSHSCAN